MTTANSPYEMLTQAAELIQERGQGYGEVENNFQLIADLFSLRVGRPFHPYEACILLECVKDARMFASPMNVDNYLDGINYKAFAALFAQDYARARTMLNDVAYLRKDNLQKAEMKPVEVASKKVKTNVSPTTTALLNVDALEKELTR